MTRKRERVTNLDFFLGGGGVLLLVAENLIVVIKQWKEAIWTSKAVSRKGVNEINMKVNKLLTLQPFCLLNGPQSATNIYNLLTTSDRKCFLKGSTKKYQKNIDTQTPRFIDFRFGVFKALF